jgi:hypothetical protein
MTVDDVDEAFAAAFAERFADSWRTPTLDKFEAMFSDDVCSFSR